MINFVKGDMFQDLGQASCAVNTINCNGVMGKGVALEFRKRYPTMFGWYKQLCNDHNVRPGDVKPFVTDEGLIVLNMATKENWWQPSEYEWIEAGLQNLHDIMFDLHNLPADRVLLPPPGCGNGGLQWDLVKPMIKRYLKDLTCEVRVYEPL